MNSSDIGKIQKIQQVIAEVKREILSLQRKKDLDTYGRGTLHMIKLIEEILNE